MGGVQFRVSGFGFRGRANAKCRVPNGKFILSFALFLFLAVSCQLSVVSSAQAAAANEGVTVKTSTKAQFAKAAAAFKAGLAYEKAKDFKRAFREYQKIVNMKIVYPKVYKQIGNCYVAFRNPEYAIKFYKMYVEATPTDTKTAEYLKTLEQTYKKKETTRLITNQNMAGAEFKSPYSAVLFSSIGLLPPACVFQGYGNYYARNRTQDWFPVSSSMAILGEFLVVADWACRLNNLTGFDSVLSLSENLAAFLFSSALIFDFASSPWIASESSLAFLSFCKTNEMKIEENRVDYRDPALATIISMTLGIIPGAGHFYAGDMDTAIKLLIFTPIIAGSTIITGSILQGNSEPEVSRIGDYVLWGGLGIYGICRLIDLYGSLTHCDKVSEEYYKQLLCPNSPFVLKEKKPEKEPWLAFAISLIPVPGTGCFYSENYWMAGSLLAIGAAGAAAYFAAGGTDETSTYIRYGGLALMALSKIYDIAAAPGYTAIYNAVYTNRQERESAAGKVSIIPSIMPDGAGVNVTYSF